MVNTRETFIFRFIFLLYRKPLDHKMVVEFIEVNDVKCKEYIKWELDQEQNPKDNPLKSKFCQDSKVIRVGKRTCISQYLT